MNIERIYVLDFNHFRPLHGSPAVPLPPNSADNSELTVVV